MDRLFQSGHIAKAYVLSRPHTPAFVKEKTLKYLKERMNQPNERFSLLLDIGCGSGQSTTIFTPHFERIIGVDPSENQIAAARANNSASNVEYRVGISDNLPADPHSVDMVIVGQAIHWFDYEKFFKECERVLKPNGCLAAYGFGIPNVTAKVGDADEKQQSESDRLIKKFTDDCHFDKNIARLFDDYEGLFAEIPSKDKVRLSDLELVKEMSLEAFIAYIRSYSGYQNHVADTVKEIVTEKQISEEAAMKIYSQEHDILKIMCEGIKRCWCIEGVEDSQVQLKVTWNVPLVMSRKIGVN